MRNIFVIIAVTFLSLCSLDNQQERPLQEHTWSSEWIMAIDHTDPYDSTIAAPYFRNEFKIPNIVKSALAHVSGVGYFEFYLNGKKVGDHVLDPAFTRYDKRVKYLSFDILEYITEDSNVAGGIVGNGFYNVDTKSAWEFDKAHWRSAPAFICEIVIEYENGEMEVIKTDESWKQGKNID